MRPSFRENHPKLGAEHGIERPHTPAECDNRLLDAPYRPVRRRGTRVESQDALDKVDPCLETQGHRLGRRTLLRRGLVLTFRREIHLDPCRGSYRSVLADRDAALVVCGTKGGGAEAGKRDELADREPKLA
jgi:hypothetical protein